MPSQALVRVILEHTRHGPLLEAFLDHPSREVKRWTHGQACLLLGELPGGLKPTWTPKQRGVLRSVKALHLVEKRILKWPHEPSIPLAGLTPPTDLERVSPQDVPFLSAAQLEAWRQTETYRHARWTPKDLRQELHNPHCPPVVLARALWLPDTAPLALKNPNLPRKLLLRWLERIAFDDPTFRFVRAQAMTHPSLTPQDLLEHFEDS